MGLPQQPVKNKQNYEVNKPMSFKTNRFTVCLLKMLLIAAESCGSDTVQMCKKDHGLMQKKQSASLISEERHVNVLFLQKNVLFLQKLGKAFLFADIDLCRPCVAAMQCIYTRPCSKVESNHTEVKLAMCHRLG